MKLRHYFFRPPGNQSDWYSVGRWLVLVMIALSLMALNLI